MFELVTNPDGVVVCTVELIELANTTNSAEGATNRRIIVQARAASPSTWGAFTSLKIGGERERPAAALLVMTKSWSLSWGKQLPG
jgi:hypothetical protein